MSQLIGQSIGRYHILEQLGQGGMATVYKGYDTRLESEVAIKFIRTEKLAPEIAGNALKRFEREAKALARLTHPNIVKVIDYGEYENRPYLVMEYLASGSLKELLTGNPVPYDQAARLLIPIAKALAFAHQQGMVHRDIKPSNILITQSGEPMLADFGIAKLLDPEATTELTATGMGIGTPEYMAPEQVTSGNIDERSDVYALGVVYYEMLTGRKPYQADTPMAVLFKHASEPLPRPQTFEKDIPDQAEHLLIKALSKNPAERFQNMDAFATALEKLAHGTSGAFTLQEPLQASKAQEISPKINSLPSRIHKKEGWKFWALWILAGAMGTLLGIFTGNYPIETAIVFVVIGVTLGIGQYLLVRTKIPNAWQWLMATIFAWAILAVAGAGVIQAGRTNYCSRVTVSFSGNTYNINQAGQFARAAFNSGEKVEWRAGFVCSPEHWLNTELLLVFGLGGIAGGAQWLVLRRHVKQAIWWIPGSAVAWLLGIYPAGIGLNGYSAGYGYFWAAGIIYAIVSGWVMVKLLNNNLVENPPVETSQT